MSKDLYACDLDSLVFVDVEQFVAAAIREGQRIDYKVDVPQDLGDVITAFSNTIGGIVMLGVEDKDGLPVGMPGVARNAKSDLKTRIVNKICSAVFPRPVFDIGIVPLASDPSRDVAVVRVYEGAETPYMFDGRKASVRIGDKCEWASRLDLERLFQRREQVPGAFSQREDRRIDVLATHPENQTQVLAETWFKCWMWPTQALNVRLERRVESAFKAVVSQAFAEFREIEIDDRHGAWVDLAFRSHTIADFNARWRLTSTGSVGFVIQPFHSKLEAIPLADVVRDAANFMRCASVVLQGCGWHGRVIAEATLATIDQRIVPTSADGKSALEGIVNIGSRTNRGAGGWVSIFASPTSIDAATFISDLLSETLRTERRSEIEYDQLIKSVQKIVAPPDTTAP